MRRALAVAMMFIGRRPAHCRPCMGPLCAASEATIGRYHAWYWPQRCSWSAVATATVGHHHAHGRPERCHPSARAMPFIGPSAALRRRERSPPSARAQPSIGASDPLLGSRSRPVPTAPLSARGEAPAIPCTQRGFPEIDIRKLTGPHGGSSGGSTGQSTSGASWTSASAGDDQSSCLESAICCVWSVST
jgi:hypothetical protein